MIKQDTLFILGAGASHPFGLPVGSALNSELCKGLSNVNGWLSETLLRCGYGTNVTSDLGHGLLHSAQPSIDAFLALRGEYAEPGKCAIAAVLLPKEDLQRLYVRHDGTKEIWGASDWYGYLWSRLRADVNDIEQFLMNKVSFITFNYDRTLETFLLHAIANSFGKPLDEAHDVLAKIKIHHVYGDLGDYVPGVGYYLPQPSNELQIKQAAKRLRVVPGTRPAEDPVCVDMIERAKNIIILGFGYDSTNCLRLGIQATLARLTSPPRQITGSCLGLLGTERFLATQRLATERTSVLLEDLDCLGTLRTHASSWSS
jgi:hypothetical protein